MVNSIHCTLHVLPNILILILSAVIWLTVARRICCTQVMFFAEMKSAVMPWNFCSWTVKNAPQGDWIHWVPMDGSMLSASSAVVTILQLLNEACRRYYPLFWAIFKYKVFKNNLCRVSSHLSDHFPLFQRFLDVLEPFPAVTVMEAQQWPQAGLEMGGHRFLKFTGKKKKEKINNTTTLTLDLLPTNEMRTLFILR